MKKEAGSFKIPDLGAGFNSAQLKGLAVVSMVIDHAAYMLVDKTSHAYAYQLMRGVGRLAFPIFAFFLVEGFFHSRDLRKYALRLLCLAAVSEIPFNLMFARRVLYPDHQNTIWTLLIGLVTLIVFRQIENRFEDSADISRLNLAKIAAAGLFAGCAYLLKTDYSWFGVGLIVLLYWLRYDRKRQCLYGGLVSLYHSWAILAFIPLYYYNGVRGRYFKYFFYIFYPAHILAIHGISLLLRYF